MFDKIMKIRNKIILKRIKRMVEKEVATKTFNFDESEPLEVKLQNSKCEIIDMKTAPKCFSHYNEKNIGCTYNCLCRQECLMNRWRNE